MSYDKYIAWRRLTNNGRDPLSDEQRAELGIEKEKPVDFEEAKRAYEEAVKNL